MNMCKWKCTSSSCVWTRGESNLASERQVADDVSLLTTTNLLTILPPSFYLFYKTFAKSLIWPLRLIHLALLGYLLHVILNKHPIFKEHQGYLGRWDENNLFLFLCFSFNNYFFLILFYSLWCYFFSIISIIQ